MCQARYHNLAGKLRLWSAEAAKCSTRNIVSIDSIAIDMDVRDLITAADKERFFTTPDKSCRALQFPASQRQQVLYGEIFTSAKGSSDGCIAYDNALLW